MLAPILELIHLGCKHDWWIVVENCRWEGEDVILSVGVNIEEYATRYCCEIACRSVRLSRIQRELAHSVELRLEHPLLVPHHEVHEELFISSAAANPKAVIGDLWLAHRAATGDWFPAHTFFNRNLPLPELLETGRGLLATGPRAVLQAYEKVLKQHGVASRRIGERDPVRWKNGRWVPESERLQVLIIGESFVVAESFLLLRVDKTSRRLRQPGPQVSTITGRRETR